MVQTSTRKGFTLIELLVVIAIIGILSSVVLVSLNTARAKARDAQRKANAQGIASAVALYSDAFNTNVPAASATCPTGWFVDGSAVPPLGCPTALVPTYMPKLPTETTGTTYTYVASSTQYCFGAFMEAVGGDTAFLCNSSGCSATTTIAAPWTGAKCYAS